MPLLGYALIGGSCSCLQELEMLKEQSRVKDLEHDEELEALRNQASQGRWCDSVSTCQLDALGNRNIQ